MRHLPDSILASLVRTLPKLHVGLPEGRRFRMDWYLGDVKADIDTTYVIERAMLSGRYDPLTVAIVRAFVKPGDVCMDVGANVGAIAFAIAKATGPMGRVFSFEPGDLTHNRLLANLALNPEHTAAIVPLRMGLSDKEGTLYWHEHEAARGNANLSDKVLNDGSRVPVTTVDIFFARNPIVKLDFVKIDVESMEYEVILGGMRTWEKHKPVLYYETLPAFEAYRGKPVFKMIEDNLRGLGYRFFKIEGFGKWRETSYPDLSANTLALPPHKMPAA